MAIPAIKRPASALLGLLAAAWTAVLPIIPKRAEAATCAPAGYAVVFFNGVLTTPDEALFNTMAMREPGVIGDAYNGEAVRYQLLYNWSQSVFQDVVETFAQRSGELDASGYLSAHWEIFWDTVSGSSDSSAIVTRYIPSLAGILASLSDGVKTTLIKSFSDWITKGQTKADYQKHDAALELLVAQRQKILLVAHSQGNLFMNHAYDDVLPKAAADSVKAIHVAPASPTVRGDWILSDADLVINGLRVTGAVKDNTLRNVPVSTLDLLGHNFYNIYLNAALFAQGDAESLRQHVRDIALSALATLKTSPCKVSTYTYNGVAFNYFNDGLGHLSGNISAVITFKQDMSNYTGGVEESDMESYVIGFQGNQPVTVRYPQDDICQHHVSMEMENGVVTRWSLDIITGVQDCNGLRLYVPGSAHLYSAGQPTGAPYDDEMMFYGADNQYFGAVINQPGTWSSGGGQ